MAEKPAALSGRIKRNVLQDSARGLNLFTSMRTGILLLTLLILLSIAGTIVWPAIYYTFGFRLITGLLCINIALCSSRRLPALWRATFAPPPKSPAAIESWTVYRCFRARTDEQETIRAAEVALRCQGFRLQPENRQDHSDLHAIKGRLAPWGTLAVHVSLLLIIVGGVYGQRYGVSSDVILPVGSTYELVAVSSSAPHTPVNLRLNNFTTAYYQDGTVSDWISDISVEQDGRETMRRDIKVNQPLDYEGLMIYQMSYGNLIRTQLLDGTGAVSRKADLKEQDLWMMDESSGLAVQAVRVTSRGRIVYVVYQQNQPVTWGTASPGELIPLGDGLGTVSFEALIPFSGFQVKHDPGIPWVWSGFVLMTAGFFLSLYSRRIELWLEVTPDSSGTIIKLGCLDGRNAHVVDSLFEGVFAFSTTQPERRNR